MAPLIWIIIVIVVLLVIVWLFYNSVISLRNEADNSWSQIDVQLKRRHDLIPNLVETVKGYAKHEKSVFENVTKARAAMMSASTIADKAKASNQLSSTLKSLFAVAENYPTLQANQNFMQLQEQLSGTESKIAYARQHYNDVVYSYNTKIQQFPGNMFASIFTFAKKDSFVVADTEKEPVKVSF